MVRVRLVATVCLVVLLAAMLAGCSAPAETEIPDGSLKSSYVDADNKTHGFVTGIVLNEAGEPVAGAMVTILSMDNSATTDVAGKFNFTGVAKGEQTLRVEKQGYKTLQRPFTVVAGKIVEFEVVFARVEGLDGGLIDHYHDKWRGHDRYTIFEGRIELDDDVTTGPAPSCILCISDYPLVLDEGRIVPPGTDRISIDISFGSHPMSNQETWRFHIFPPPSPDGELYETEPWILASEDEHLEYDLPSSEITDHGHATYTNWRFALTRDSTVDDTWPQAYNLLFPNSVDVTITAHKGDLVIDPPHPRYWAETDRIEMPTGPTTSVWCTVAGAVAVGCESRSPNPDMNFGGDEVVRCSTGSSWDYGGCMVLDRGGLVPPGTTGISFDLEMWQGGIPNTGVEPPAALVDTDWVLGFKTAAPPRGGATWNDFTWVEPVEAYDPEPQQSRYRQEGLRYEIDVPKGGEDPYYTVYSGWVFMMAVRGHETANDWSDVSCGYYPCGSSFFELKNFFVHNDSSSDPEPA